MAPTRAASLSTVALLKRNPLGRRLVDVGVGLPRFGGQASGLHGCECTGVDGHLLVVDRTEVANR